MRVRFLSLLFIVSFFISASPLRAVEKTTIKGVVSSVRNGDTLRVTFSESAGLPKEYFACSRVYKTMAWIYLLGVKSPDIRKNEYCGKEATVFSQRKIIGKNVKIEIDGCGSYGGLRAFVTEDSFGKVKTLNFELVEAGFATVKDDTSLFKNNKMFNKFRVAQNKASDLEIGLWGEKTCRQTTNR